jgi:hemerythrin
LRKLFIELNLYARFHFLSEENLMMKHGYPELARHKEEHLGLMEEISAYESDILTGDIGIESKKFLDFLSHWFTRHIQTEDKQFAAYLAQQNADDLTEHASRANPNG